MDDSHTYHYNFMENDTLYKTTYNLNIQILNELKFLWKYNQNDSSILELEQLRKEEFELYYIIDSLNSEKFSFMMTTSDTATIGYIYYLEAIEN